MAFWNIDFIRPFAPLLAFAGFVVLLLYVIAPLILKSKNWMTAHPQFLPLDLGELQAEVAAAFYDAAQQLAALGFTAIGHVKRFDPQIRTESHVSVWAHPKDKNICQVIAVRSALRVATLVTFRQEYEDGSAIVTSNTTSPGVFPKDPQQDSLTCSGVHDLELLYRLHCGRTASATAELRRRRTPTVPAVGQAERYMADEWSRTFQRLCGQGYFTFDQVNDRYVKTTRGAYIMTWRLLWPWKQLRLKARDRRAEQVLSRLGMPTLGQCRASQPKAVAMQTGMLAETEPAPFDAQGWTSSQ
jgi:hypothetical protein